MCKLITWDLGKTQILIQEVWVEAYNSVFHMNSRCFCCWLMGHTLNRKSLDGPLKSIGLPIHPFIYPPIHPFIHSSNA